MIEVHYETYLPKIPMLKQNGLKNANGTSKTEMKTILLYKGVNAI